MSPFAFNVINPQVVAEKGITVPTLYELILCLQTASEVENLFRDVGTPVEISSMIERYRIALLLHFRQKIPYRAIQADTNSSIATIIRVNRFYSDPICGGYKHAFSFCTEETSIYECILSLKTLDSLQRFMYDLFTPQELKAMSSRAVVAFLLLLNYTQHEINQVISVSAATITRVKRFLEYERHNGYRVSFERYADKMGKSGKIEQIRMEDSGIMS